jgi:hypothetical protein
MFAGVAIVNLLTNALQYMPNPIVISGMEVIVLTLTAGPAIGGAISALLTAWIWRRLFSLPSLPVGRVTLGWALIMFVGSILAFAMINLFLPLPPGFVPSEVQAAIPFTIASLPLAFMASGFFSWILPGILGGILLSAHLYHLGKIQKRKHAILAIAGWGLGLALGGGIGRVFGNLAPWSYVPGFSLVNELKGWISFGITGFAAGLAGAWATTAAIRAASIAPAEAELAGREHKTAQPTNL